ncbi:MAG: M20/M25/M40 family metallo-hydrolase [Blastochloris sp.]|nr:M20/M25/M40 family metallo-hydrolase [Blastochloris sp.]
MKSWSAQEGLDTFFHYLRFPTVSARPEHAADMRSCAIWLLELMQSWGASVSLEETGGPPIILAEFPAQVNTASTLLIYGHYDVQPAEPLDLWQSPPFSPELRDGKIVARGATDNKGQTFSLLLGLREMLAARALPVKVTVMLEGEEEVGSPHLAAWVEKNKEALRCDAVLICDTSMIETGWPAITTGLRGIDCFDFEINGPRCDLHSGMFGGPTPNPALALARILTRLHNDAGEITIPHFYDGLIEVSPAELKSWQDLPWNETWFEQATGIKPSAGERNYSVLEKVWSRPTAEINGISSGYQGSGSKTIIPACASAKVSFRLVPGQDPQRIAQLVQTWFKQELMCEHVTGRCIYDHGGDPFFTAPDHPSMNLVSRALTQAFGRAPAWTREGLSIPVAALLQKQLQVPVILAGLGLPDCQAHAPNETFPLTQFEGGARFVKAMLQEMGGV